MDTSETMIKQSNLTESTINTKRTTEEMIMMIKDAITKREEIDINNIKTK